MTATRLGCLKEDQFQDLLFQMFTTLTLAGARTEEGDPLLPELQNTPEFSPINE
jgi:hypothetical protein